MNEKGNISILVTIGILVCLGLQSAVTLIKVHRLTQNQSYSNDLEDGVYAGEIAAIHGAANLQEGFDSAEESFPMTFGNTLFAPFEDQDWTPPTDPHGVPLAVTKHAAAANVVLSRYDPAAPPSQPGELRYTLRETASDQSCGKLTLDAIKREICVKRILPAEPTVPPVVPICTQPPQLPVPGPSACPDGGRRVFLTSIKADSARGSRDWYTQKCNELAQNAGLGGTDWKAIMCLDQGSSHGYSHNIAVADQGMPTDARDYIGVFNKPICNARSPWYGGPEVVANNEDDFWTNNDTDYTTQLHQASLAWDESGARMDCSAYAKLGCGPDGRKRRDCGLYPKMDNVWNHNHKLPLHNSTCNCGNWTQTAVAGPYEIHGYARATTLEWAKHLVRSTCPAKSRWYCIEDAPTPVQALNVNKAGTGSGTVTSAPAGINCSADCVEPYTQGTSVTLTAQSDPGSVFTGWSGDCTGVGPCVITMSVDRNVTATFTVDPCIPVVLPGSMSLTIRDAATNGTNTFGTAMWANSDLSTASPGFKASSGTGLDSDPEQLSIEWAATNMTTCEVKFNDVPTYNGMSGLEVLSVARGTTIRLECTNSCFGKTFWIIFNAL